jgi:hypothetical protein
MAAPLAAGQRLARPVFGINHIIAYGQSLASGWEGWPALSLTPRHDSLMLGGSVRPAEENAPHWRPVGQAALQPLAATVQDVGTGALLTPEQVAALPPGNVALGETVLEAAVNAWRTGLQDMPEFVANGRRLLASSCGVGGRRLEQLSKGAQPELFNRLRECATLARRTAAARGLGYGVVALLFLQGEHNNRGIEGGTSDRAEYKAMLQQFYCDFVTDIATGIAGQSAPPAMFLHQTGGAYSTDENAIPQAQLEAALELPGCYLAAPAYPVTSKGGHLDANGYRWLGAQFGKVMHRVLSLGEDWKPLHPRWTALDGCRLLVHFHVPAPPLAWGRPFDEHTAVAPADRGFTVVDAAGVVPIAVVELADASSVRITLARPPGPEALLRYADRSRHGGRGALHDSDATVSEDRYAYDPGSGHYASANLPDLVGRPYPLMNWCVAFTQPIGPASG